MVPPIGSIFVPQLTSSREREPPQTVRRDRGPEPLHRGSCAFRVSLRLVAHGGEFCDATFQRRVGHVDHAVLDRFVKALQLRFRFAGTLSQFRNVPATAFIPFLTSLKQLIHHRRQTRRIEQPPFQVIDDGAVELVHRHRQTATTPLALPRLRGAGVVTIHAACAALASSQRHRAAAGRAEADSSQQSRTAHRAWWHPLRAARLQRRLNGRELRFGDDRWNVHNRVRAFGLGRARLVVARIESVLANISRAREDLMHRGDAPAAAVASTDVAIVEIGSDRLDPQRASVAVTIERQPVDQAHRVGVYRVDLPASF
jgi:hypothetical protein